MLYGRELQMQFADGNRKSESMCIHQSPSHQLPGTVELACHAGGILLNTLQVELVGSRAAPRFSIYTTRLS